MAQFIKIEWQASPSPISGYNIYRGNSDGNESNVPLNNFPITDTFYDDYTIFPGQIYNYVVTAVLNGVESTDSLKIFTEPIAFTNSPSPIELSAFAGFGLLAGSTITNVPGTESEVTGDVGVYPGSSITGFENVRISGSYHLADYVAGYAQNSLTNAFNNGMGITGSTIVPAELGGLRLLPGVYSNATSVAITGVLVLDGEGNPNASWIFQIGTTLTTAVGNSHVVLVGGAQATNVTWLVGSSATIGADTFFAGNIIAYASITVNTLACVNGRLGARSGAITLDDNSIIIYGSCYEALPASPPNTPPVPPTAPIGVHINDLNADGLDNNIPIPSSYNLGFASNFALLTDGAITISNPQITVTNGNSGQATLTPPDGITYVNGYNNGISTAVVTSANNLYNELVALSGFTFGAVNLETVNIGHGTGVFIPGVYVASTGIVTSASQTITLVGDGDYVFISQGGMTFGATTTILLTYGAQASKVYWVSAGAITTGAVNVLKGNFITSNAINIGSTNDIEGRLLSTLTAEITLDGTATNIYLP